MKGWMTAALCLLLTVAAGAQEKKLFRGFDGGMMVHTGYLSGTLDAIGYEAKGAPACISAFCSIIDNDSVLAFCENML